MLPSGLARDVLLETDGTRFTAIRAGAAPGDAARLDGVALPGLANCHSHAFHRALRGRTHGQGGTFWTWREQMYTLAERLDPGSYFELARAVYAEMALAGITSVGEFHYLHHDQDGHPYADPNAMSGALAAAARDAGIRLTLIDACYLSGGVAGETLDAVQRRFSDGTVERWASRVGGLGDGPGLRHGVAVHSVRAVPAAALALIRDTAGGRPLHVHLSEQPAENQACRSAYGVSPTRLLADHGVLGPSTTAVHAVHVDRDDIGLLASTGTTVCLCPSTEHDLADGIAPAVALRDADVPLTIGSDQHVLIDLFAEAQLLEGDQRAISLQRGRFSPGELFASITGHGSLGWPDTGCFEVGARADLVAVRLDTVRTAGADPAQALLAASAADVDTVVVDGSVVVRDGVHRIGDVAQLLGDAIRAVT